MSLPSVIAEHIAAVNAFDEDRVIATFADDAVVNDNHREPFTVPPAELAVLRHRGPLSDVDLTYSELGSYATRHEISVDGPLREYYVCDSWDTSDES